MKSETLYERIQLTIDIVKNPSYTDTEKINIFRSTLLALENLDIDNYDLVQSILSWSDSGLFEYSELLFVITLKQLLTVYGKSIASDGGWI